MRSEIALPFIENDVNLPNNRAYTFNRMVKLEQRFKKDQMLKNNYNFMGELLDNGHAVITDSEDNVSSGKVWYQSHFGSMNRLFD